MKTVKGRLLQWKSYVMTSRKQVERSESSWIQMTYMQTNEAEDRANNHCGSAALDGPIFKQQ